MYCDGTTAEVHLNQINADDWEIWKEEKSLSDDVAHGGGNDWYPGDKVKKAIKRLRKELPDLPLNLDAVDNKIIEIFGSKLTEGIKW